MVRKILFLVPYPLGESPSQRFRFEQYFSLLDRRGYTYDVQPFLNSTNWRAFYNEGKTMTKIAALCQGMAKRTIMLFKSPMYDFVFIHREVAPLFPPMFEWLLAKIFRKKIVYDFDDAIWLTDRTRESWYFRILKSRSKVSSICKWSYKVSCGNDYLCNYASRFCKNVVYNPTTIDTEGQHNPSLFQAEKVTNIKIRIGWTGSHSTLKYLLPIEPMLRRILVEHANVEIVVIADQPSPLSFAKFVPWNAKTEILDLSQFDIGIMPLPDDDWTRGKCGFKALQYMALKCPVVASPVGVNQKIIQHAINGFLCNTLDEWENTLRLLIENANLRKTVGLRGRQTVLKNYSVLSNSSNFLSLFG